MSRKTARNLPAAEASQAKQSGVAVAVQQTAWHGPLPSPDQLARFDAVVPGAAERIIRMAEQEGAHTREVELRAVKANVRLQHIGQALAFIIAVGTMATGYRLAMSGHDWVAGVLVGTTLIAMVGAFLGARKAKK